MIRSNLNDYSYAYILVSGTTKITGARENGAVKQTDEVYKNKEVIFKTCVPFTGCISEIINTQIDNAKDKDVVILIYDLIECSDNYSKTSRGLW